MTKKYIVAITGASGVIYGVRLIDELLKIGCEVSAVVSDPGKYVLEDELNIPFKECRKNFKNEFLNIFNNNPKLNYYEIDDLKAPISSGSYITDGMIIIPCTMSTAASIAAGISKNLIERAADVMLKEKRKLIIVPRETPLNTIHIKNMLTLSEMGISIIPAMPGFYNKPSTIDDMINFIVGKILDALGIENSLYKRWNNQLTMEG